MKRNKTILKLPFREEWYVFWGGSNKKLNHHYGVTNQRYAYDFAIVDKNKKTYKGVGLNNKDYYCFGKEILSPANGVVAEVVDGVRDNKPNSANEYFTFGNVVLIKHKRGEISVLAHLKKGSIKVKEGDKVKSDQVIGLCGNSGNSTEPHLHYHLQNNEIIQNGKGIKIYFKNIEVKRKNKKEIKKDYSPIKGDFIEQYQI